MLKLTQDPSLHKVAELFFPIDITFYLTVLFVPARKLQCLAYRGASCKDYISTCIAAVQTDRLAQVTADAKAKSISNLEEKVKPNPSKGRGCEIANHR